MYIKVNSLIGKKYVVPGAYRDQRFTLTLNMGASGGAAVFDPHSHAPVQLGDPPLLRLVEQGVNFLRRKILRALDQISGIVVDHNQ